MKHKFNSVLSLIILVFLILNSFEGISKNNKSKGSQPVNNPVFTQFVYEGNDQVYKDYPLEDDEFYSPILQGCYPDPAIIRKGDDYFMVHSSFAMFPGVPIFHSNDLVKCTVFFWRFDPTKRTG